MSKSFSLGLVRVKLPPLERFREFLVRGGKRLTAQRRQILEQVFSHHDHFDAEELLDHLQPFLAQRALSRPTVYRTLNELVEAGLLRKMTLGGRSVFEHDYGYPRHDHLYCENCNKLIEFHSPELERLCAALAKEYRFQVAGHRMFVIGLCAECRSRNKGTIAKCPRPAPAPARLLLSLKKQKSSSV